MAIKNNSTGTISKSNNNTNDRQSNGIFTSTSPFISASQVKRSVQQELTMIKIIITGKLLHRHKQPSVTQWIF